MDLIFISSYLDLQERDDCFYLKKEVFASFREWRLSRFIFIAWTFWKGGFFIQQRSWSGFFAAQRFKLWASRRVWSGLFDVMNSYGQWNEELTYKKWHLVLFMDAWASFAKSLFVIYWMDQANHTAIYRRFFNNPSYKMFHTS